MYNMICTESKWIFKHEHLCDSAKHLQLITVKSVDHTCHTCLWVLSIPSDENVTPGSSQASDSSEAPAAREVGKCLLFLGLLVTPKELSCTEVDTVNGQIVDCKPLTIIAIECYRNHQPNCLIAIN